MPARALADATGLSIGYCRQVKKGVVTPHPMWWEAMFDLASSSALAHDDPSASLLVMA